MMRKLTTLATTAIAAVALLAVAAAPANADRAFQINDPEGISCAAQPGGVCIDTGYSGYFDIGSATCYTSFDVAVTAGGAVETTNVPELYCENQPSGSDLQPCTSAWNDNWTGQVRVPDTGPSQIDLDICISQLGIWTMNHEVAVSTYNNPRRWEQNGTATISPSVCCPLEDSYYQDNYEDDNTTAILL